MNNFLKLILHISKAPDRLKMREVGWNQGIDASSQTISKKVSSLHTTTLTNETELLWLLVMQNLTEGNVKLFVWMYMRTKEEKTLWATFFVNRAAYGNQSHLYRTTLWSIHVSEVEILRTEERISFEQNLEENPKDHEIMKW